MINTKPQNIPWTKEKFVEEAKKVHGNKFEYVGEYVSTKVKIKIKCLKCNNIFEQRPSSHLHGTGCKFCQYKALPQNNIKGNIESFELECKLLHDNKYDYFQDYSGKARKIKILCKKHDNTFK